MSSSRRYANLARVHIRSRESLWLLLYPALEPTARVLLHCVAVADRDTRRKTLLPVQLHYPASSRTPHCPSCSKEVSNSNSSVLLTSREPISASTENGADVQPAKKKKKNGVDKDAPFVCGHVVCQTCADTIVKPQGRCCICEAKIGPEGMVPIGKDGEPSFAAWA